jgi:hypothetical protein
MSSMPVVAAYGGNRDVNGDGSERRLGAAAEVDHAELCQRTTVEVKISAPCRDGADDVLFNLVLFSVWVL